MKIGRRTFLGLGAAVALPCPARAQRMLPVVGFLHEASADAYAANAPTFAEGLRQAGFVEAQNLAIEYRFAAGQVDSLAGMAADLAHSGVVLIVAGGARAAMVAAAATTTIPIVFVTGSDPFQLGLVTNPDRPGGNVTGVTFITAGLSDEKLDLLDQLVPQAERIGYLAEDPSQAGARSRAIEGLKSEMSAAAGRLGREVILAEIGPGHDYEAAFALFEKRRADAVVVAPSLVFANDADDLVGAASVHEVPTIYPRRADVLAGGLMSYGARLAEAWRACGVRVGELLQGAKAADLPVIRASGLELVISRLIAKSLGLAVPASLLARADEVLD